MRFFALHGISVPARCGGTGKCGKCKIRLLSGSLEGGETAEEGIYLACLAVPLTDCKVLAESETGSGLEASSFTRRASPQGGGTGVAVDVGTTTIAASLVGLSDGKIYKTASCLNPQAAFGSDVLSRIRACADKQNLGALTACVREAIGGLIRSLTGDGREPDRIAVAGNTTMLHLLYGADPSPIGIAPFTPVFTDLKKCRGEELGFRTKELVLLPSVSAYVGADITADILSADMLKSEKNVLLIDLGTNGEMALSRGGKIVCTSTAAGPALEGACISCGIGGVDGAVNRVWTEGDQIKFTTVGNRPPVGICGAGLVDFIAVLLESGKLDGTGYLSEEKVYLCDGIFLSRADVRQFQLAKAAISAGVSALLRSAGLTEGDVDECLIAGGLGSYMSVENAVKTGLIPAELKGRTRAVGNGSLYGAQLVLADPAMEAEAVEIAEKSKAVELSGDTYFADEFVRRMCFDGFSDEI